MLGISIVHLSAPPLCAPLVVPLPSPSISGAVKIQRRPVWTSPQAEVLKDRYFDWLLEHGQEEKAGEIRERDQRFMARRGFALP